MIKVGFDAWINKDIQTHGEIEIGLAIGREVGKRFPCRKIIRYRPFPFLLCLAEWLGNACDPVLDAWIGDHRGARLDVVGFDVRQPHRRGVGKRRRGGDDCGRMIDQLGTGGGQQQRPEHRQQDGARPKPPCERHHLALHRRRNQHYPTTRDAVLQEAPDQFNGTIVVAISVGSSNVTMA